MAELDLYSTIMICFFVFLAGLMDSIVGGGGLISLPAYLGFGLPPHQALATNKFSSSLGTFVAVLRYLKAGHIQIPVAVTASLGALIGSALGGHLAVHTRPEAIEAFMLFVIPVVLIFFLLKKKFERSTPTTTLQHTLLESRRWKNIGIAFLIGSVIGFYDGFFGPGTGAFLTLALHWAMHYSLLTASANARMINLASNIGALVIFLFHGKVMLQLGAFAAVASITGNFIGSKMALRKGEKIIRPLMIFVLVLLFIQIIIKF